MISAVPAFLLTAFSLAELGDGFGMFFDMYLLALGWSESWVIISQVLRGIVDFLLKGVIGDVIDKTTWDRRLFLGVSAAAIGISSLMVFLVQGSDTFDLFIVNSVRMLESIALAFLGPAFGAITLSAFGPERFDEMNVKKEVVSHAGSIISSILSAVLAWVLYPDIQIVFTLPIVFAISAAFFVRFIPEGDPLMGRGFHGKTEKRDENGAVINTHKDEPPPEAAAYKDVFLDKRIVAMIVADVFHVIAEANVGLIFNETLAGVGSFVDDDNQNKEDDVVDDDNIMSRSAIPYLATAGSLAQITMIFGTILVGWLTARGWGRKPFYMAHLCVHPVRVLLLLLCFQYGASQAVLASTELVGGLTGAFGIVNAFMRADILFGSGRFNVVDGVQATIRGVAATSSQLVGAYILSQGGPMVALGVSFVIAVIPPVVGAFFVPETLGMRQIDFNEEKFEEKLEIIKSTMSGDEYHAYDLMTDSERKDLVKQRQFIAKDTASNKEDWRFV